MASISIGSGEAGAVTLRAPRILVDASLVMTTALRSGDLVIPGQEGTRGGDITIDAEELLVTNGGQLDASTFIAGPAGGIDITAGSSIRVEGDGSGIASRTGAGGEGGGVTLRAQRIELADGGEVSAESAAGLGELGPIRAPLRPPRRVATLARVARIRPVNGRRKTASQRPSNGPFGSECTPRRIT